MGRGREGPAHFQDKFEGIYKPTEMRPTYSIISSSLSPMTPIDISQT